MMQSFHNDPAIKARYIARVRAHRKADDLVKGATGNGGKGCAVWCTLDAPESLGAKRTRLRARPW